MSGLARGAERDGQPIANEFAGRAAHSAGDGVDAVGHAAADTAQLPALADCRQSNDFIGQADTMIGVRQAGPSARLPGTLVLGD